MKNSATAVLISVTLAFAAFVGGFCLGRSTSENNIEISALQTTTSRTSSSASPTSSATSPSQTVSAPSSPDNADLQPTASSENTSPIATIEDFTPALTEPATFPININTATLEELDLIPGIGPTLAQRILDFREEIGGFQHVDELLDVKGIGEKTLDKIKEYITL